MKTLYLVACLFVTFSFALFAEDVKATMSMSNAATSASAIQNKPTDWNIISNSKLLLTQSLYNAYWTGKETSDISWTLTIDTVIDKQLSEVLYNRNSLKIEYGQKNSSFKDGDQIKWNGPEKISDIIDFQSLFLLKLSAVVDPYFAFRLLTQSNEFFKPATLTESVGGYKTIIDSGKTSLTARLGIAVNEVVNPPENMESRVDGGLELISEFNTILLSDTVLFKSWLDIYQALLNSKDVNDDWKMTDLDWQNTFTTSVSKFIDISLYAEIKYDKELSHAAQFKEILGATLLYRLF